MRHLIFVTCMMLGATMVWGQDITDTLDGEVTYLTSQSVYVKFQSTKGIAPGDTLFVWKDGALISALVVKNTSSTSCVGTPLTDRVFVKGETIVSKLKSATAPISETPQLPPDLIPEAVSEPDHDETTSGGKESEASKQAQSLPKIKGRLSAASYINFSDRHEYDQQRMRYTLTFQANRIANTPLSLESYVSFRHTINEWQDVKDDFLRMFKVYTLALQYSVKDNTRIWFGRKINPVISNIGAIDGLQVEQKFKSMTLGVFAGSRPDHSNYGFNFDLLQYGAYVGHTAQTKNGLMQSTIAFAEQRNHAMTDRRFAYIQHVNSSVRHLNIFTSFEFDLYTLDTMANNAPKNTFNITSVYLSMRYKISDKLSVFGSYDARKNIIYYETYKNFIDQLLEDETRQGLRFSFNFRPWKKVTVGSSAGYRFQKDNPDPSKNMNTYVTISRVPGLNMSTTVSVVMIQSAYLDGLIYGVRASRDLIKGKLFGELEYRWVKYTYRNVETPLRQSIAGAHFSWRFSKKLSFALNYEGEIQKEQFNNRIYTNITQRF